MGIIPKFGAITIPFELNYAFPVMELTQRIQRTLGIGVNLFKLV